MLRDRKNAYWKQSNSQKQSDRKRPASYSIDFLGKSTKVASFEGSISSGSMS